MRRRQLITALGCCTALRVAAQDDAPRARHKVSAQELHRALMARFPLRFGLPGVLDAQLDAAGLQLLPARQRLGATVMATVTDLSSRAVQEAELDLLFAIRLETSDQTLRAHAIEVTGLRSQGLPPEAARTWQGLLGGVVRRAVHEVVLHRLSPRERAMADLIGLQPETLTIEDDGVIVWFGPRPRG